MQNTLNNITILKSSPYEIDFEQNNRVLIVGEFGPDWEKEISQLATEYDLNITYTHTAKEAFSDVKKHGEFSVIVFQNTIPDISPKDFFVALRKEFPNTYLVILTEIDYADTARSYFKTDSNAACIIKPIMTENFCMMIKKLANKFNLIKKESLTIAALKEKEVDMEILSTITKTIVSSLNFDKIISSVLDEIINKLPIKQCAYIDISQDGTMRIKDSRGISGELLKRFPHSNIKDFSLSETLYSERREIYVEDVKVHPNKSFQNMSKFGKIKSIALFPVVLDEKVVGILSAYAEEEEGNTQITPRVFSILRKLSELLAISLRNASKYKTVADFNKELLSELKKTSELGNKICSTLDINELLQLSVHGIDELIPCEAQTLLIINEETGSLDINYGIGGGINEYLKSFNANQFSLVTFVLNQNKALVLNKFKINEQLPENLESQEIIKKSVPQVADFLLIPVVSKSKTVGLIISMDRKDKQPFDETDLEHVSIVASQIGIAVENAKLTEEKNKRLLSTSNKLEQTQAQLFQSEKMAALGQLAGGVAHEINNPLGGVVTNLEHILNLDSFTESHYKHIMKICESEIKDKERLSEIDKILQNIMKNEEKKNRWLQTASKGGIRCKSIVQNLLIFSRQSKASDFDFIDINECIETTIHLVDYQFQIMNLKIERSYGNNLSEVYGNRGELSQVFLNLLLNSSQATKGQQGSISIKTYMDGTDKNYALVEIKDCGCGIPEDIKDRIFEPFFTTKKIGEGTGLGLSIVHQIVEKHAGMVSFESSLGEGTAFYIKLPCKK
ncbi:MAG: hypothetical protein A3C43_11260 [Candidatus Schekmanbacteria bacterium RIFCSPHIGHO2_02_FULL_38_11]|nr:MAG: hypothetical protein A3C43_11260 [Candidatus Schekmanbacteria bacterium RIFCSPHIGHO2_02_FULL_38_11]